MENPQSWIFLALCITYMGAVAVLASANPVNALTVMCHLFSTICFCVPLYSQQEVLIHFKDHGPYTIESMYYSFIPFFLAVFASFILITVWYQALKLIFK
jgi:hypothetical protein